MPPQNDLFNPTDFKTPFVDPRTGILSDYWQRKFGHLFGGPNWKSQFGGGVVIDINESGNSDPTTILDQAGLTSQFFALSNDGPLNPANLNTPSPLVGGLLGSGPIVDPNAPSPLISGGLLESWSSFIPSTLSSFYDQISVLSQSLTPRNNFVFIPDTLAHQPNYPAPEYPNSIFFATDVFEWFWSNGIAWNNLDFLINGNYLWKAGTAFTGTLVHANTANRVYTFPDSDGAIPFESAPITNGNLVLGGGGALIQDSTIALPGTLFSGTAVLAKITGGGANGSIVFTNGFATAYTAPT